ncbi:MAG: response regulator [Candidatus Margulisiibacteriota bacterium]
MAKKVLIVEDYPATSKMIAEILEMEGYQAVIAADGLLGVEKALSEKPDLILLDIMLPGIDGLEVCSRLRANEQTKDIPVIMVSVKASDEDVKTGLGKGANGYISKPFDPFKLLEVVKKHLGTT